MADTNIKHINTRIISKHITLEQANTGTWTPYEGEIVLARVDTTQPDGHGGVTVVPTYLMKVGATDSQGKLIAIKDLKWAHAPASDVYAWAKQQKLAITSTGSGNVVSNIEATDTGITITKTTVATTESIGALESALQTTDAQLREAFASADNSLHTTIQTEIATAKSGAISDAASDATTKANTAEANAKSYTDTQIQSVTTTINNLDAAYKAADEGIEGRLEDLESALENVSNVMDFRGAVDALPAVTGYQNGDVIVVTKGDDAGKEFVLSGNAWVEFGSTSATDAAVAELTNRVGTLETFTNTTVPNTYATIANLSAEESARTQADTTLGGRIDDIDSAYKAADSALETKLTNAIATAKSEAIADAASKDSALHTTISAEIDSDIAAIATTLRNEISAGDSAAVSSATGYTDTQIEAVEKTISDMDAAYKLADTNLSASIGNITKDYLTSSDKTELADATSTVATNLANLSNTVSANQTAVENNFLKVVNDNVTYNGMTVIFDCGGVETA